MIKEINSINGRNDGRNGKKKSKGKVEKIRKKWRGMAMIRSDEKARGSRSGDTMGGHSIKRNKLWKMREHKIKEQKREEVIKGISFSKEENLESRK